MVVLGCFVGMGPPVHRRWKDTRTDMRGYNSLSHAWCASILNTTTHGGAWVGKISVHVMCACLNYSCALCAIISQRVAHQ
jgi:hypothetical protein